MSTRPSSHGSATVDTSLLASYRDGNYMVRRYMLSPRTDRTADYSVLYRIDMASMQNALSDDNASLAAFNSFIERIMSDTLIRVADIRIVGYSSPDGSYAANERLAEERAQAFKNYVDGKYDLSAHYKVTTAAVAEDWDYCRQLVETSASMPDRSSVLKVIDSSEAADVKEQQLKAMPAAWNYMRQDILPQLRKVDVAIDYGTCRIVEVRMPVETPKPKPAPKPAPQNRCCMCCNGCPCSSDMLVIEVDDALLNIIEGMIIEEIDAELIELELP